MEDKNIRNNKKENKADTCMYYFLFIIIIFMAIGIILEFMGLL